MQPDQSTTPISLRSTQKKLRILVVDDENMMLDYLAKALAKLGHLPFTSDNPLDAFRLVINEKKAGRFFDVAIIDFNLGHHENGYEVANRILSEDDQCKVIALSGDAYDPVIQNFQDYGFKAAITKPFTIDQLDTKIQEVYRQRL